MELDFTEDPPATAKGSSGPALTAQRMKYAAEVKVFESRYGNLEDVRKNLGFSQRKMCQMLLVDPSAWTRWHSASKRPPPHIYRAIEWYLALEGRAELHPRIADLYARGCGWVRVGPRGSEPLFGDQRTLPPSATLAALGVVGPVGVGAHSGGVVVALDESYPVAHGFLLGGPRLLLYPLANTHLETRA